jgi:S-adenosylmethionine synthetase
MPEQTPIEWAMSTIASDFQNMTFREREALKLTIEIAIAKAEKAMIQQMAQDQQEILAMVQEGNKQLSGALGEETQ